MSSLLLFLVLVIPDKFIVVEFEFMNDETTFPRGKQTLANICDTKVPETTQAGHYTDPTEAGLQALLMIIEIGLEQIHQTS